MNIERVNYQQKAVDFLYGPTSRRFRYQLTLVSLSFKKAVDIGQLGDIVKLKLSIKHCSYMARDTLLGPPGLSQ